MPKGHPPPEDNLDPDQITGQPPAGGGNADDPATGFVGLTPEHVRNTPEYRELARQNRILARQKGESDRLIAEARAQAEAASQAAEAERMAAQEAQVRALLGDDGVAMWSQFADLSATDPVKAAELLAQYTSTRAQSPAPVAQPQPATGGTQVPPQQQPPATGLSRTVGEAPLAGTADDTAQVIEALEKRYSDLVERNADPVTRNRVTMKDRASGMIAYLGAAYLKAGARPKS